MRIITTILSGKLHASLRGRHAGSIGGFHVTPFCKIVHVKQRRDVVVIVNPSSLDVAEDIIKKQFKDVKLMELLAHLLKAIHGHVSVLPVAICFIAICTVAICRVARWVLYALVVGVTNGERAWLCILSEFSRIPTEVGQKSPAVPECERNRHRNVL